MGINDCYDRIEVLEQVTTRANMKSQPLVGRDPFAHLVTGSGGHGLNSSGTVPVLSFVQIPRSQT